MKKTFAILSILGLCIGLVGCKNTSSNSNVDSIKLLKDNGYNLIYEPSTISNADLCVYIFNNDHSIRYRYLEKENWEDFDYFSIQYDNEEVYSGLSYDLEKDNFGDKEVVASFEKELKKIGTNFENFIKSLETLNKNYEKECEKIISISASYNGETTAGTVIENTIDSRIGIDVVGTTDSGVQMDLHNYSIENPSELNADQTSIYKIKYFDLSCELPITCTTISEGTYKSQCQSITYEELARNGDNHKGEKLKFTGKVLQVMDILGGEGTQIRIATKGSYDDVVLIGYIYKEGQGRYLEKDSVTVYGECNGLVTYEAVSGANITIPSCSAEYIDIN